MEDENVQQEPQSEGNDSFLDGWEETGPVQEVTDPGGDGGNPAGEQEEGQTGAGEEAEIGSQGGESGPQPEPGGLEGGVQSGPGGEALPPDGEHGQTAGQAEGGQEAVQTPKTWTVPYMGQAVTVSEADVPGLAQRALDYDRIHSAYEEARPVMDLFRGFADRSGMSVQEYVARLRVQAKQMEGLDEGAARQAVEMEDREARVSAQENANRQAQEAARQRQENQRRQQARVQADVQEFISVFPDAARDFNAIPREVWDAVNGGMSLVAAYVRYNNARARDNAAAEAEEQRRKEAVRQQNGKNAAASTGSMKSAGSSHGPKDPFLEGWDE